MNEDKLKQNSGIIVTGGKISATNIAVGEYAKVSIRDAKQSATRKIDSGNEQARAKRLARRTTTYDVFLAHASADKETIVQPLALELSSHDVTVWYDDSEISLGENIREKIDRGLLASKVGVFVISTAFMESDWSLYEFESILSRAVNGDSCIVPIWHDVSDQQTQLLSPLIRNVRGAMTSVDSLSDIAASIASLVQRNDFR